MITNEKMAVRTAKNLVKFLNEKGVKCSSDYRYKPIRKIMRECWYVKKLVECGQTDCIHIDLECGSFILITNDCKLMSGFHVMIQDAIYSIYLEYVDSDFSYEPYDTLRTEKTKFYSDMFADNGMFLTEPKTFSKWVGSLEFYS